ncbi:hypothetical protein NDU88_003527 [Pleurodeles waltl]|uniref:Uncharacterized protein n=1 Tax=Pleurodeles waltl TaxID=8319 RepID=A0AAV7W3U2_PLEWA|nr:hypothetical protein NDU88_003527 [Pleurodeles waltl]
MIPYRPPERADGTESFTRCQAQTLSPSGEPGVRIERTECRQSESPKPEKSKSPKGMRAQTTQSFPVIRGIGSVLFPLRVYACILIYGSPSSFSRSHAPAGNVGNVGGFFPNVTLGSCLG